MIQLLTAKRIFKSWCIFILCAGLGGAIAGAIAGGLTGFVMGVVLGLQHVQIADVQKTVRGPSMIMGFIAGLPISFLFYWWTVKNLVTQICALQTPVSPELPDSAKQ